MVESYLSTLCATGMLQQSSAPANSRIQDQIVFTRTELGSKFLEAFVELYRAAGEESARLEGDNNGKRSSNPRNGAAILAPQYLPCMVCATHPSFASIPPITLHRGAECEICHTKISA